MGIYLVGFICGFLVGVNREYKENRKMTEYREVVIKIPEEIISFVNLNGFLPENYRSAMGRVLLDGVELPKGHGSLIDIQPLMRGLYEEMCVGELTYTTSEVYKMLEEECHEIIEADKESE